MNIENNFIPYEQALALKELGFDEPCFSWYGKKDKLIHLQKNLGIKNERFNKLGERVSHICTTPLYQQSFDFFREKYNIHVSFKPVFGKKNYNKYRANIYVNETVCQIFKNYFPDNPYFDTYEEARQACLEELIKIAQKQ